MARVLMVALASAGLSYGCSDPEPASIRVSDVRLVGDPGTNRISFVTVPYDAEGKPMSVRGSVTARVREGDREVCAFTGGSTSGRMFRQGLPEEELFTSPCPPPAAGAPPRDVDVLLVTSAGGRFTARAPIPADAVWVDPAEVAAFQAEAAARESAPPPQRRSPEELLRETLDDYVASVRRAIAAVPVDGTGEAPACQLAPFDAQAIRPIGREPASHGRLVLERWARGLAAAAEAPAAELPALPATDQRLADAVNSPVMSRAVAFQARLARDPAIPQNDLGRIGRAVNEIGQDGPRLRIVRALEYVEPVVERTDSLRFAFEPARLRAVVFVVDRERGEVLCVGNVDAANQAGISWRSEHGTSVETVTSYLLGDLSLQAFKQLDRVRAPPAT